MAEAPVYLVAHFAFAFVGCGDGGVGCVCTEGALVRVLGWRDGCTDKFDCDFAFEIAVFAE